MIPCRRGSMVLRGSPPTLSESCRCSGPTPRSPRARASRGTPATALPAKQRRAPTSCPQLLFAGAADHAPNLDDILLVARVEQQLRTSARTPHEYSENRLDVPRLLRHH